VTALWIATALIAVVTVVVVTLMLARLPQPGSRHPLPQPRPVPAPAEAVVLVHGFMGFDKIELLGRRLAYFRGIAPRLQAMGVKVYVTRVPPLASVPERAARLAEQIAALPERRVVVIAHSMGGLDARWAIGRLGLAPRIAALVTIGTPHRGAPLATLGRTLRALHWLTPGMLERFNREIGDHPEVFYGSVVSTWIAGSDGVVPVTSQRWGEVMAELECDHWAQVGWSRRFDPLPIYVRVLDQLAARGLFVQAGSSSVAGAA
jgi:triacylglycerol lipase